MRHAHSVLLVLGLCVPGLAHAQGSAQATETGASTYLLRLERAHYLQSVCVLLRGNGQYHLERHNPQKIRIFEGSLHDDELRNVVHIVSGDRLFNLEQKQIPDLMLKADNDQVILEVHRPGSWQQLIFPDSASRQPFRDAMDPLLKWLDAVNKRKVPELSEEAGRNNCLPSSKLGFSQRKPDPPEQPVTSPLPVASVPLTRQETYALQMFDNRVVNYRTEATCLLVSPSGAYHLVKQSKSYSNGLTSAVLDGTLTPMGLASLRAVLDAPDLMNHPEEKLGHEVILTSDSYFTRLNIPRGGKIQQIAAWKSYRIINQTLSRSVEDHGTKLLASLREWLKANVNEKSAIPTSNPPNPRCIPGG